MSTDGLGRDNKDEQELLLIDENDLKKITEVSLEINKELLERLRSSLGYLGPEENWVKLKVKLLEYQFKLGKEICNFPTMIDYLKLLAGKGLVQSLPALLELAMSMPVHQTDMEIFVSKLINLDLTDPVKHPLAVLHTLMNIGPASWKEAVWYMELMQATDVGCAEIAAYYLSEVKNSSPMVRYACLKVVHTGRIETMENFIELVKLLLKVGDDFGKEVKPILDAVESRNFAQVEMLISALKEAYGVKDSYTGKGLRNNESLNWS
ncbi:hypothetical protein IT411_02975 [Candidatus Peregrinibacteria bacterium]|nr:hypothetical protein [Candidatus Peregrinibacteria bacterium]